MNFKIWTRRKRILKYSESKKGWKGKPIKGKKKWGGARGRG